MVIVGRMQYYNYVSTMKGLSSTCLVIAYEGMDHLHAGNFCKIRKMEN